MKLKNNEIARYDGANWMLEYAKKNGIEAAEAELKYRGIFGISLKVDKESLDRAVNTIKTNTIKSMLCMAAMVLHDEFEMSPDDIQRFGERFRLKLQCLAGGYSTWQEYRNILKDELGMEFDILDEFKEE